MTTEDEVFLVPPASLPRRLRIGACSSVQGRSRRAIEDHPAVLTQPGSIPAGCGAAARRGILSTYVRRPNLTRISSLAIGLILSLIVPVSGQESQPSQIPSQKAQSKAE